jgi:hypothetical protein
MRAATVVRAVYGMILFFRPDTVIRTSEPVGWVTTVGRILGLRHMIQALTVERRGTRGWLVVGALLDIIHALSMVAVAALSEDHRRLAALDVVVASSWALYSIRAIQRS